MQTNRIIKLDCEQSLSNLHHQCQWPSEATTLLLIQLYVLSLTCMCTSYLCTRCCRWACDGACCWSWAWWRSHTGAPGPLCPSASAATCAHTCWSRRTLHRTERQHKQRELNSIDISINICEAWHSYQICFDRGCHVVTANVLEGWVLVLNFTHKFRREGFQRIQILFMMFDELKPSKPKTEYLSHERKEHSLRLC